MMKMEWIRFEVTPFATFEYIWLENQIHKSENQNHDCTQIFRCFFGRFYSFIQNIVKLQMIYLYQEEKEKN